MKLEKSKTELTVKEQKFIKYWLELGNGTEAVKRAGYKVANNNVAGVLAHRLLRKTKIQLTTKEEMSAMGLTPEYRYDKLMEIIEKANYKTVLSALKLAWEIDGSLTGGINNSFMNVANKIEPVEFVLSEPSHKV